MNKIRIPKSFQLFGQTITVEWEKTLRQKYEGDIGQSWHNKNKIVLHESTQGSFVEETNIEDTFFHELTHFCLRKAGKNDLSDDESFVSILAGLLHQAFKTAEYDEQTPQT